MSFVALFRQGVGKFRDTHAQPTGLRVNIGSFDSGLRSGFANTGQVAAYHPVNIGYEHNLAKRPGEMATTIEFRVDVVNVFDEKYELRDGSGIGVGGGTVWRASRCVCRDHLRILKGGGL